MKDLSKFSDEEILSIYEKINRWEWDERLGKKPFMFDKMLRYKKPHNMKYRLNLLFCAIWPFTKEDYIRQLMREKVKRDFITAFQKNP